MSDSDQNHAVIRHNVEKLVSRQKWRNRLTFFVVHLLFYAVSLFVVWRTLALNPSLNTALFDNINPNAGTIVILPTILWTLVLLFHIASLFFESSVGEKAIREQVLMREIREEILRQGLLTKDMGEKPKRRAALSDDGELVSVEDAETTEQTSYTARASHLGS